MEIATHGFVLWDVETTGASPTEDHIISIGAVMAVFSAHKGFEFKGEFHSFVATQRAMDPEAEAVHHISSDMIADAPKFPKALEQFTKWITSFGYDKVILTGHNSSKFDDLILLCNMTQHSLAVDDFFETIQCYGTLDTLKAFRAINKIALAQKVIGAEDLPKFVDTGKVSYTLGNCHLHYVGKPIGDTAHDALVDSRALFNICSSPKWLALFQCNVLALMAHVVPVVKAVKALKQLSGLLYQHRIEKLKHAVFEDDEDAPEDEHVDAAWGNVREDNKALLASSPIWGVAKDNVRLCLNCITFCTVDDQTHTCF